MAQRENLKKKKKIKFSSQALVSNTGFGPILLFPNCVNKGRLIKLFCRTISALLKHKAWNPSIDTYSLWNIFKQRGLLDLAQYFSSGELWFSGLSK